MGGTRRETCAQCGEELTDEELDSPMDEFGVCDDCADDAEEFEKQMDKKNGTRSRD